MPRFEVRFKGMLTQAERERLAQADVTIKGQERALRIGDVKTGLPIFTVELEAASAEEALQKVRDALEPDTANFSGWKAGPA